MSMSIIEEIQLSAREYPNVEEGQSCSQSAYKVGGKAFLYIGMQGGRAKAMFKLKSSREKATDLARQYPEDFQLGSTSWVTARFTDEDPISFEIWQKWLDESYQLAS